jgi:long-subunit fatty acid transport protein
MDPITGIGRSFVDMPDGTPYDFVQQLNKVNFSLGLEYDYNEQFFGRIGYFNESKQMGNRKYVTFGAGFKLNVFALDVAYVLSVTKNNPLDQTLRFTLGFNMNGIKVLSGTADAATEETSGL